VIPPELFDDLSTKIGVLAHERRRYLEQLAGKETDGVMLERARVSTEELVATLDRLQTQSLWRPGSKRPFECPIKFADETMSLRRKLLETYASRQVIEAGLCSLSSSIEEVMRKIDKHWGLDRELHEARTEVKVKQSELKAVNDEIVSLQRLLARKKTMLTRQEKVDVKVHVRVLEAEKRVVQKRLCGHQEHVRTNEQAIRHRALVIAKLEQKIECLANVLGGDDGAAAERVDVQLVADLQTSIEQLVKQTTDQQRSMDRLDAELEDLEARMRTLAKATAGATEEERKVLAEHRRMRGLVEKELSAQLSATAASLETLQAEITALRAEERSRSQRSTTSAS
jgi:hypothetical protein